MKPLKIILLVILIVVACGTVFVFWQKGGSTKQLPETPSITPPIENLLFIKKEGNSFTPDQQKSISEFKAKILARARLGIMPTEAEKNIFSVVISDKATPFPNGEIVVDQKVLKFTPEEIGLIEGILRK